MYEGGRLLLRLMEDNHMEYVVYKRYKDVIDFIVHWQAYIVVAEGEIRDNLAVYGIRIEFHLPVSTAMFSDHLDRRLPILELKVWIGMGKDSVTRFLYTHYMKDVSSGTVMHEMWSHSESMKFNLLVNEMLRILINCSPYSVERRRCEARDILHEADAVIGFP
jgi:hypothetical protein